MLKGTVPVALKMTFGLVSKLPPTKVAENLQTY